MTPVRSPWRTSIPPAAGESDGVERRGHVIAGIAVLLVGSTTLALWSKASEVIDVRQERHATAQAPAGVATPVADAPAPPARGLAPGRAAVRSTPMRRTGKGAPKEILDVRVTSATTARCTSAGNAGAAAAAKAPRGP
ncbi:MAG: hypothetical protein AAF628_17660 [Planctomycetota bacterium]